MEESKSVLMFNAEISSESKQVSASIFHETRRTQSPLLTEAFNALLWKLI